MCVFVLVQGIDLQKSVTNLKACSFKWTQLETQIVYIKNSFWSLLAF